MDHTSHETHGPAPKPEAGGVVTNNQRKSSLISKIYKYKAAVFIFGFGILGSSWVLMSSAASYLQPPTNLKAGTVTQTSVTLSWTRSTSGNVKNYQVFRNGSHIATVPSYTSTYSSGGLTAATAYRFKLRATDNYGRSSSFTPEITATTLAAATTTTGGTTTGGTTTGGTTSGTKCVVNLHGKGGTGYAFDGGYDMRTPTGNSDAWGGKQWLYFPDTGYQQVKAIVENSISGCGKVVIHGFSNGAAAAGKLYCRGETFGGRVVGYVVDDPVTDHAVANCAPATGMKIAMYWTGALNYASAGFNCLSADWTCEGGTLIGPEAYQNWMKTARKPSKYTSHTPYNNPPELALWLQ